MKTLIISLYDGTSTCSAALLDEQGNLENLEVSNNIFHLFASLQWCPNLNDPSYSKLTRFLDNYEAVILCEDGCITKIK